MKVTPIIRFLVCRVWPHRLLSHLLQPLISSSAPTTPPGLLLLLGFLCNIWAEEALVVKTLPANAGDVRDVGSVPRLGRSPGGGHGNPLQYCCLEGPSGQGSLVAYSP